MPARSGAPGSTTARRSAPPTASPPAAPRRGRRRTYACRGRPRARCAARARARRARAPDPSPSSSRPARSPRTAARRRAAPGRRSRTPSQLRSSISPAGSPTVAYRPGGALASASRRRRRKRELLGQPLRVGARLQPRHELGAVAVVGAARQAPDGDARRRPGRARARPPPAWRAPPVEAPPRMRRGGPRAGDDRPQLDVLLARADRAVLDQAVVTAESGQRRSIRFRRGSAPR